MIYKCNIHCHNIDLREIDALGLTDKGKWLPFAFDIGIVVAVKMSTDEEEELSYKCTTVFTEYGDTYIIDTKYNDFLKIWTDFISGEESEDGSGNDLEL